MFHRDNLSDKVIGILKTKNADLSKERILLKIEDISVDMLKDILSKA